MKILKLIEHLKKFVNDDDISIQWAKDAESILDEIEDEGVDDNLIDVLDTLQDRLSIYCPGGGDYLIDERDMKLCCKRIITVLQGYS